MKFDPDYRFRPWLYSVSHSSLLIRAENADDGQNVDLMFFGVRYWQMTSAYTNLCIHRPTQQEIDFLRFEFPNDGLLEKDAYVLEANDGIRYLVVASAFEVERNRHSPRETSLFH